MRRLTVVAVIAAVAPFGCGGGSLSPKASAHSEQVKGLAGGQVDALPSGNLFLRVIGFSQRPMAAFPSHKHTAGFVYVAAGVQRLHSEGAPPRLIEAG